VINGTVVRLQAQIGVILCLPESPNIEIKYVVDTGFEGETSPRTIAIAQYPDEENKLNTHREVKSSISTAIE
jgi:predicted aspartyl protease